MKELKVRELKWFGVMAKPGFKLRAAQLQRPEALFATPTRLLISLRLSHLQCNYKVKWRTEWFLRTMTTLKVSNPSLPTTFLKTCVSTCCFSVALLTRLNTTRFVYKYLVLFFENPNGPHDTVLQILGGRELTFNSPPSLITSLPLEYSWEPGDIKDRSFQVITPLLKSFSWLPHCQQDKI